MLTENNSKTFLKSALHGFLLVFLILINYIEFLNFFAVSNNNTFFNLPMEAAVIFEFFVTMLIALPVFAVSLYLLKTKKSSLTSEYFVCSLVIALNLFKLAFYIPNINIHQEFLWYVLKQLLTTIFGLGILLMALLRFSDIKYRKYQ
ncbi:hypothetical protein IWB18_05635 [Alkalibacter sp. M17DMB]|nr:hypothetical protein [Alkalibacter mobilis]